MISAAAIVIFVAAVAAGFGVQGRPIDWAFILFWAFILAAIIQLLKEADT